MSDTKQYKGLTDHQVAESRAAHGNNVLTPPQKESVWKVFLKKFTEPLIVVLLIAGVLSIGISCYEYFGQDAGIKVFFEPAGIFIAVILATGLAFIFERKAAGEFELLNKVNDEEPVPVIRNGQSVSVPKSDVVVGDIVILDTGCEVPADGRLLQSTTLSVDESTLTGEPLCRKSADPADNDPDATFATDMVLRGTKVMEGHGVMQVTAVGDNTEHGNVYRASQIDNGVETPLSQQLGRLGGLVSKIAFGVSAAIIVGRIAMYFVNMPAGAFDTFDFIRYALESFMIAVALIVVAVPEGLPMAVTLSLAYSMRKMLRTNNLVRKLHACETMGAATVICTDKTGTLTCNRMEVYNSDFFGNPPTWVVDEGMAVNSTARLGLSDGRTEVLGNPTEGALLLWLRNKGADYETLRGAVTVLGEIPFSTERKYMATEVRRADGQRVVYVKGAPEIVYGLCASAPGVERAELDKLLHGYQDMAMRTLGFAYAVADGDEPLVSDGQLVANNLIFIGVVAINDPVRTDVPEAMRTVLDAGIAVKIVTGDTPGTAREIGRRTGLWNDATDTDRNIITGPEFAALTEEELDSRVEDIKIIARARPMDKKRLVEALQRRGEVVAVTGDGTNDAPALKAAQVGLSMGDGTSVAKEASDITIIDNSFASIGRAVMWGRSLYHNIQRFVMFQMTVNVCASLIVALGAFLGIESPLTVTQMLWVNLIMDTMAAVALASLPASSSVMTEKPRKSSDFIITRPMFGHIFGVGIGFFVLLCGVLWYLRSTDLTTLTQVGRLPLVAAHRLTTVELSLFFTIFVFLQLWNLLNAKAFGSHRSTFRFRGCSEFLLVCGIIVVGQICIIELGGEFFNVCRFGIADWLLIALCTMPVLLIGEVARSRHAAPLKKV